MTDTQSYTVSIQFRDDAVSDAEYAELMSDLEQVDGIAVKERERTFGIDALSEGVAGGEMLIRAGILTVGTLRLAVELYKLKESHPAGYDVHIEAEDGSEVNVWNSDYRELYNIDESDDEVIADVDEEDVDLEGVKVDGNLTIDGDLKMVNSEDASMIDDGMEE